LSPESLWKLKWEDGKVESFIDIRRKVGNRVLRAYLLDPIFLEDRIETMSASLRGPKDEFKDFANFLILRATKNGVEFRVLAEAGIYENMRMVATDSEHFASQEADVLEREFTDALQSPNDWKTKIILSPDSKVPRG
jgi:hypothetical protein